MKMPWRAPRIEAPEPPREVYSDKRDCIDCAWWEWRRTEGATDGFAAFEAGVMWERERVKND